MIWLQGVGGVARTTGGRPSRSGAESGFEVPAGEAESATAGAPTSPVALGAMLVLQEAESGAVRDREARRHAEDVLAELARLQRTLLADGPGPAVLDRLEALARAMPAAADPRLNALLGAVVLRAEVELARHRTVTTV